MLDSDMTYKEFKELFEFFGLNDEDVIVGIGDLSINRPYVKSIEPIDMPEPFSSLAKSVAKSKTISRRFLPRGPEWPYFRVQAFVPDIQKFVKEFYNFERSLTLKGKERYIETVYNIETPSIYGCLITEDPKLDVPYEVRIIIPHDLYNIWNKDERNKIS